MKPVAGLRLRTSIILLLVSTILVTMAIVGTGILVVMVERTHSETRVRVAKSASDLADRVELFLGNVQSRIDLAGEAYHSVLPPTRRAILDRARQPPLTAVYVIAPDGRLMDASIVDVSDERTAELAGIDLSGYPFFRAALGSDEPVWSDKHLSVVTGTVTLGLALTIIDGGVVIAELPLQTLLDISRAAPGADDVDTWIIDSKGEIVADTGGSHAERRNLFNHPLIVASRTGGPQPDEIEIGGTTHLVAGSYSRALGWHFVSRSPAGLSNPRIQEIATVVLVGFVGAALVGLMLAPLWAQGIVRPLTVVATRANQIARGERPTTWPRGRIAELNHLLSDLAIMTAAIVGREEELRRLNEELEDRVAHRTEQLNRSNDELAEALAIARQAKDELIQSEKLAALGRLVAGVAHELNTPIGNGRMAITSLIDRLATFEAGLADGLRKSDFENFIESVRTGSRIAETNLRRASQLISSFKQVAADRAGSRRRRFQLREVVDEVLLTLSPTTKGLPIEFRVLIPDAIEMDSYPGDLGQVLTNMVENAVLHAFEGRNHGTVDITAHVGPPDRVHIRLQDDGVGMPTAVARRAFDPFFTTRLGQGGSGLGLFVAHATITNVLGGTVGLETDEGRGTAFALVLPRIAPQSPGPK